MRLRDGVRVIERADGAIQVGSGARVVLAAPTAAQREWLQRFELKGWVSAREAAAQPHLLAEFGRMGLLEAAAPRAATIGFDRATPLAVATGAILASDGATVCLHDERPLAGAAPLLGASGASQTRQSGAAEAIRRIVPEARLLLGSRTADAWVIVSDAVARRESASALLARDVPHVFAVATEAGIEVGPFVVPGASACGTCDSLARAESDPSWPGVELALLAPVGRPVRPRQDVLAVAAGLLAAALAAWRRDAVGPWLGVKWIVTEDAAPTPVHVAARPDCGCGASGAVGDETAARRARW